ncbi:MAG: hypothetical protein LBN26_08480 [Christensenellaceae bacterium]|jgi:hypothetical protein|nr:hypothetical protein [Christensenellaceae bacterium]
MKKIKGAKAFPLLLAAVMICALLPSAAFAQSGDGHIDLTDSATPSGTGWTYSGGVFTVTGDVTISGATTTNRVVVQSGVTANITLDGVSINVSGTNNACAFDMTGATVNLTLTGTNTLKSDYGQAGLQVPSGASLTITAASTGSLAATGGDYGAGIGGGDGGAGGNITISGGTVEATGGRSGAGIGGGWNGSGGTITITGGTVEATGGDYGAGIGGGDYSAGGVITISGGTVEATGGGFGAGIGGGPGGAGGDITISGGTVEATGGGYGTGIGGGYYGAGGDITISGGTVEATGGNDGTGIGGGLYGAGGDITISGGTVTAIGDYQAFFNAPTVSAAAYTYWTNTTTSAPSGAGTVYPSAAYAYSASHKYVKITPPSAVVDNMTVNGTVGTTLTGAGTAYIWLTNETVASSVSLGDNAAGWFSNLPAGMTATIGGMDATYFKVDFGGMPSAISSAAFDITIPGSALTSGANLAVTANPNAKFNITAAAATPSATVADVTITGTVDAALTPPVQGIYIALTNATLDPGLLVGANAASWFSNLPAGMTAIVSGVDGGATIRISLSGTPTVASLAAFDITIPGSALTSGVPLAVTANPNAKFNITAAAATPSATVADVTVSGTVDTPLTTQTATITLTNETVASSGFSGLSAEACFANLPTGIAVTATGVGGSNTITVTFSGTPTAVSSAVFDITIPGGVLTGGVPLAVTANPKAKFAITATRPRSIDDDDDWSSPVVTLPLPIQPPKTGEGAGAAWLLVLGGMALAFALGKKRQGAK